MGITKAGRELANTLEKAMGKDYGLANPHVCSELVSAAKRYHTIQEHWCNDTDTASPQGESLAKREANLETKIRELVKQVPHLKGVRFTGDPRGYCVKLERQDGRGNTWGGDSEGWGIG